MFALLLSSVVVFLIVGTRFVLELCNLDAVGFNDYATLGCLLYPLLFSFVAWACEPFAMRS